MRNYTYAHLWDVPKSTTTGNRIAGPCQEGILRARFGQDGFLAGLRFERGENGHLTREQQEMIKSLLAAPAPKIILDAPGVQYCRPLLVRVLGPRLFEPESGWEAFPWGEVRGAVRLGDTLVGLATLEVDQGDGSAIRSRRGLVLAERVQAKFFEAPSLREKDLGYFELEMERVRHLEENLPSIYIEVCLADRNAPLARARARLFQLWQIDCQWNLPFEEDRWHVRLSS